MKRGGEEKRGRETEKEGMDVETREGEVWNGRGGEVNP